MRRLFRLATCTLCTTGVMNPPRCRGGVTTCLRVVGTEGGIARLPLRQAQVGTA
jgi:hypothetical protein